MTKNFLKWKTQFQHVGIVSSTFWAIFDGSGMSNMQPFVLLQSRDVFDVSICPKQKCWMLSWCGDEVYLCFIQFVLTVRSNINTNALLNSVILGGAAAHLIKLGCYTESINIKRRMGIGFVSHLFLFYFVRGRSQEYCRGSNDHGTFPYP